MAKKTNGMKSNLCPHCCTPRSQCNCHLWLTLKGLLLLFLGLGLLTRVFTIEQTISTLLILFAFSFLLRPLWDER